MKKIILNSPICAVIIAAAMASCSGRDSVKVVVSNPVSFAREGEMVEVDAQPLLEKLGTGYLCVTDSAGEEIPSQITYDGKLIFRASVAPGAQTAYFVSPSDTLHIYDSVATGRIYPERADDIAWENDYVGYRIYGPTTQAKGEKAFGYDIFFKHPTPEPILEKLYAPETDPATWVKVDSLRAIDPLLAEEYIKSFSYHIDHGLGMDCYAVGPTLGAGVAALMDNDSIRYQWCYQNAEVLDNGPLRFTVRLDFAPMSVGSDSAVTEHRVISLDAGSHLNRCMVTYDGLGGEREVVAGFPRRDDSEAVVDYEEGILAYADPTQGDDNGKALLGLLLDNGAVSADEREGHILLHAGLAPEDTLSYRWGFAWDRADIKSMPEWNAYLRTLKQTVSTPLEVEVAD